MFKYGKIALCVCVLFASLALVIYFVPTMVSADQTMDEPIAANVSPTDEQTPIDPTEAPTEAPSSDVGEAQVSEPASAEPAPDISVAAPEPEISADVPTPTATPDISVAPVLPTTTPATAPVDKPDDATQVPQVAPQTEQPATAESSMPVNTIVSFDAIDNEISVDYGTPISDIQLPVSLTASMSQQADKVQKVNIPVTWDLSGINVNVAGSYSVSAKIDDGYNLACALPVAKVNIQEKLPCKEIKYFCGGIPDVDSYLLIRIVGTEGKPGNPENLPDSLGVRLTDGEYANVPIYWTQHSYDAHNNAIVYTMTIGDGYTYLGSLPYAHVLTANAEIK